MRIFNDLIDAALVASPALAQQAGEPAASERIGLQVTASPSAPAVRLSAGECLPRSKALATGDKK